jgi:thiamine-phosphate pyrophosphorylase
MEKAVYRIMDANFNRAREALRTMEEYCRFVLNDGILSGRAKQLRHQLSRIVSGLDTAAMLCSRDAQMDVGKELRVEGQMKRATLEDCFAASAKRISEALRMLAEVGQTIDPMLYDQFENLRFQTYTLEKDISLSQNGYLRFQSVGLYVLITVQSESEKKQAMPLTKACIEGGADGLQLRCKGLTDKEILSLAQPFVDVCRKGSVLSIINDRPDIAVICGADGVHLGQGDLSVHDVRRLQQKPLVIGKSTHNTGQLNDAINELSDYVALGPVFATATKQHEPPVGLTYVSQAMNILKDNRVGHVAIGGIDLKNIEQVLQLGVKTVAIGSAICMAKDPAKQCAEFKKTIQAYRTQHE